jgi:DNA-directed RNA polymerase subunit M
VSDKTDELKELFTGVTGKDTVTEEQEKDLGRDFTGEENDGRPTTEISCPECENNRAYYEMKQIRAADESETRFFECADCEHRWREDDH